MKKINFYFDVDGVLADFHSVYDHKNRDASLTYEFIRNLKPFEMNIQLVKQLIAEGHKVYISTRVANKNTQRARIEWINEYLPEIPNYRIITILDEEKKQKHEKMKTKTGILIDDKKDICRKWERAGHKAIWLEVKGGEILI